MVTRIVASLLGGECCLLNVAQGEKTNEMAIVKKTGNRKERETSRAQKQEIFNESREGEGFLWWGESGSVVT